MALGAVRRSLLVLLACGAAACGTLERSSREVLSENQSSAVVALPLPDVLTTVTGVMRGRGFALVEQRDVGGGVVYKYKGTRLALTTHRYGGPIGAVPLGSSSTVVGSAFFVRLAARGATATEVYILGKPTVDGAEVCTPFDLPSFECKAVRAGGRRPGREAVRGDEEAATVRLVFATLRQRAGRRL
jgi:hypothetical protein